MNMLRSQFPHHPEFQAFFPEASRQYVRSFLFLNRPRFNEHVAFLSSRLPPLLQTELKAQSDHIINTIKEKTKTVASDKSFLPELGLKVASFLNNIW